MSADKASALRGGMGEQLLKTFCIGDRKCSNCTFAADCIVQRTMYTQMEDAPEFMTHGNSLGYVLSCDDKKESLPALYELPFSLIIFGNTIIYTGAFIQALTRLGEVGLGKNRVLFKIKKITDYRGNEIYDSIHRHMLPCVPTVLEEYVQCRLSNIQAVGIRGKIEFVTPLRLKHNGHIMREPDMEQIIRALKRRIYMLACYEKIPTQSFEQTYYEIPSVINYYWQEVSVYRRPSLTNERQSYCGLTGYIQLESINEETLKLLLAGEVTHIGKMTSFGFGKYVVS